MKKTLFFATSLVLSLGVAFASANSLKGTSFAVHAEGESEPEDFSEFLENHKGANMSGNFYLSDDLSIDKKILNYYDEDPFVLDLRGHTLTLSVSTSIEIKGAGSIKIISSTEEAGKILTHEASDSTNTIFNSCDSDDSLAEDGMIELENIDFVFDYSNFDNPDPYDNDKFKRNRPIYSYPTDLCSLHFTKVSYSSSNDDIFVTCSKPTGFNGSLVFDECTFGQGPLGNAFRVRGTEDMTFNDCEFFYTFEEYYTHWYDDPNDPTTMHVSDNTHVLFHQAGTNYLTFDNCNFHHLQFLFSSDYCIDTEYPTDDSFGVEVTNSTITDVDGMFLVSPSPMERDDRSRPDPCYVFVDDSVEEITFEMELQTYSMYAGIPLFYGDNEVLARFKANPNVPEGILIIEDGIAYAGMRGFIEQPSLVNRSVSVTDAGKAEYQWYKGTLEEMNLEEGPDSDVSMLDLTGMCDIGVYNSETHSWYLELTNNMDMQYLIGFDGTEGQELTFNFLNLDEIPEDYFLYPYMFVAADDTMSSADAYNVTMPDFKTPSSFTFSIKMTGHINIFAYIYVLTSDGYAFVDPEECAAKGLSLEYSVTSKKFNLDSKMDGETSATLSALEPGAYYCEVTWDKGLQSECKMLSSFLVIESDEAEVEGFIETCMHMDDYNENLGYCKDQEHGYYSTAKTAYNALTNDQKEMFCTDDRFADAYARLSAWAEANGDVFETYNIVSSSSYRAPTSSNGTAIYVIIGVSVIAAFTLAFFLLKKKKEN